MQYNMKNTVRVQHWDGRERSAAVVTLAVAALAVLVLTARVSAQQVPLGPPTYHYPRGEGAKITGYIVSRRGDDMMVRDETTHEYRLVTLTNTTKIESPTGFMNMDRKPRDITNLLPGLLIAVKGTGGERGNLLADKIKFHSSSLKVASAIAAGEVDLKAQQRETHAQTVANTDSIADLKGRMKDSLAALQVQLANSFGAVDARMSDMDDYATKFSGVVNFATNSAMLTDEAKATLDGLVTQGQGLEGYLVEVAGFADNTGTARFNQRLSTRRADAVVQYLTQQHTVPLRRIVNPMGLGTSRPVGDNDTADGRAQNRRVEVKVLVNRGILPPNRP